MHWPKYSIEYNHETSEDHGVVLYDYAVFSGAQKSYQETSIPGMIGNLVSTDEGKSNLTIQCTFGVLSPQFMGHITDLKRWLRETGILKISDHPDIFYKVWKVNYGDIERELWKFGRFSAIFTCTPYQFLTSGMQSMEPEDITYNPYDISRPIYTVTGSGSFAITVNEKTLKGTVNGTLTIDTERMIAYNAQMVNQSSLISGDYEDLYLPTGEIALSISSGKNLKIIPQWGYDV